MAIFWTKKAAMSTGFDSTKVAVLAEMKSEPQ